MEDAGYSAGREVAQPIVATVGTSLHSRIFHERCRSYTFSFRSRAALPTSFTTGGQEGRETRASRPVAAREASCFHLREVGFSCPSGL